jgi:hypothetical protein
MPSTFAPDHEVVAPFCHPEYDGRGLWTNFGERLALYIAAPRRVVWFFKRSILLGLFCFSSFAVGPYSVRRRCIAGRFVHDYAFDYVRQLMRHESYSAAGSTAAAGAGGLSAAAGAATTAAAAGNDAADKEEVGRIAIAGLAEAHEGSLEVVATLDAGSCASVARFPPHCNVACMWLASEAVVSLCSVVADCADLARYLEQDVGGESAAAAAAEAEEAAAAGAGLLLSHRSPGAESQQQQQSQHQSTQGGQQAKLQPRARETVHVLVSDHGSHMGPFYEYSEAGKVEHRLPALFLLVPNSLLARHPEVRSALEHNQHALVTPLDLHRTIKHLAVYGETAAAGTAATTF